MNNNIHNIAFIHENINYIDTEKTTKALLPQQDKTTELQSFKISTGLNRYINLINIYKPKSDCNK